MVYAGLIGDVRFAVDMSNRCVQITIIILKC